MTKLRNLHKRFLWGPDWEEYEGMSPHEKVQQVQAEVEEEDPPTTAETVEKIEQKEREQKYGSKQLAQKVEDKEIEGWKAESYDEDEGRVVMRKEGSQSLLGHILIALLTIWWTFGIGNVIYMFYRSRVHADKIVVRADD